MYRGWKDDDVSAVTRFDEPGINRSAALILSTGYALPGVECWTIPVLGFLAFPPIIICVDKAIEGSTTTDIGAHVVMDVFPKTLDEFVQTGSWASSILFKDKDGDGLIAKAYGGNDPDDTQWDTDGDGLSDGWEMQMSSRRADQGGSFYDPLKADTDGDGLSDYDEMIWGTNPNGADTDGDGISDPSEVQGWLFHYITPAGAEKVTRIYTDPLNGDIDNDGMDDLFERTLNTSCDNQTDTTQRRQCYRDNPYNPNVWNTNPIGVFTEVGDPDSVVRPGQTFVYSTTVQNSVKAGTSLWVRGNTQLTVDNIDGYPLGMTYDIPKDKSQSLYSDLTVNTGVGNQQVNLTTDVHSQLHTPSDWGWDVLQINPTTLSGTIPLALSALPVKGWGTAYAALGLDAQGVRVYSATAEGLVSDGALLFGGGTLEATDLPSLACNNSGTCLAVGAFRDVNTDAYSFRWRTVSPDAASLGTLHTLAVPGLTDDGVASDGNDFLVTWSQGGASNKQINVLYVLSDGNQNGSAFTVDTHAGLDDPELAFIGNQYQVAWNRNGDIYTAYITGTTVSEFTAVSATSDVEDTPRIGYDPLSDKSLVVYQRANANLRGRIVDAAGARMRSTWRALTAANGITPCKVIPSMGVGWWPGARSINLLSTIKVWVWMAGCAAIGRTSSRAATTRRSI